jgi:dTDP-4-dehydrorhamnose 3,5-epimerase
MRIIDTALPGVKILEPKVFGDGRGFFFESWNERTFEQLGLCARFVQDNHSGSARGVLRGLHYQLRLPQGKLVRTISGAAFDVIVDLRRSSQTFGRWVGVEISAENRRMVWIPEGFAHGFLALQDGTEILYKATQFYAPEDDRSILWSDPQLGIDWPLLDGTAPILSGKDAAAPPLAAAETYP